MLADVAPAPLHLGPAQTISLDYNEAGLTSVLKGIAYSYDLNLVVSKEITGKVSAQLKNVSLDDALNALLGINGYTFYREDNIVFIMPKSEMKQVIVSVPLKYLPAIDAQRLLSKAISSSGNIQVNESTNSLVVMDYPQDIEKVKALLKDIDTPPIQVLIEARIVDIKDTDVEKIGTAINATYSFAGGSLSSLDGKSGSSTKDKDGGQVSLIPNIKNLSADITIDALVQEDRARILASPSIATLSGQEARIIIGDRYPYVAATSVTGSTATTSTEFVDVGTTLRVTPTVSPDGWITMKVHPEVSSVVNVTDAGPQITTREADAMVRVRDNETIIIGGLISRNEDRSNNGVPVLKSIPIVGWLFQRRVSDQRKSELTVFITPHIIRSPQEPLPGDGDATREVFVGSGSLGRDMDILSGLVSYADELEADIAKNPSNDLYLSAELLKTYKTIYGQFPDSGKSDYCLYKIAVIYAEKFGKCSAAYEALQLLKKRFPDSFYIASIEGSVDSCLAEFVKANDPVKGKIAHK